MTSFYEEMEKLALDEIKTQQRPREEPSLLRKALPYVAGAGAALGGYKWMRSGGTGRKLLRTTQRESIVGKNPNSLLNRVLYGADEVRAINEGMKTPKRAKLFKGDVFHDQPYTQKYVKGTGQNIGKLPDKQYERISDKLWEQKLLQKHAPEFSIPSKQYSGTINKDRLKSIHAHHVKGESDYFIKPISGESYDSGIGGIGFLNSADVHNFVHGYKLSPDKAQKMKHFMKNPKQYMIQKDVGIAKAPLSGANSEFRVHVVNGKVVSGATSNRALNAEEIYRYRQAEKSMQAALDKLPAHMKREGVTMAADIARTKDGYKILELNAGAGSSGLLDPVYLSKSHGAPAAVAPMMSNMAMYKHITGRRHAADAAVRAAALGSGAEYVTSHMTKKEEGR